MRWRSMQIQRSRSRENVSVSVPQRRVLQQELPVVRLVCSWTGMPQGSTRQEFGVVETVCFQAGPVAAEAGHARHRTRQE